MMKVVITGGTGMIGSALARDLAADGHEVIVLTRSPEQYAGRLPEGVQALGWDGRSAAGWGEQADGADAIVNLAGESLAAGRWTPERKKRIMESRTNAGTAVTDAVRNAKIKPKVVIQASAIGYYGIDSQRVYTESDESGDSFENRVVQAWERSSVDVQTWGVRWVAARIAVVLSTKGGALPRMLLPFRMFVGGPLGSGKQPFAWIHIDDLVKALRFLIDNPMAQGPINLASPERLTNAKFGKAIGRVMGRPAFVPAPAFAIRLLFGEMATVVLDGRWVSAENLLGSGFELKYPTAERALQAILG